MGQSSLSSAHGCPIGRHGSSLNCRILAASLQLAPSLSPAMPLSATVTPRIACQQADPAVLKPVLGSRYVCRAGPCAPQSSDSLISEGGLPAPMQSQQTACRVSSGRAMLSWDPDGSRLPESTQKTSFDAPLCSRQPACPLRDRSLLCIQGEWVESQKGVLPFAPSSRLPVARIVHVSKGRPVLSCARHMPKACRGS